MQNIYTEKENSFCSFGLISRSCDSNSHDFLVVSSSFPLEMAVSTPPPPPPQGIHIFFHFPSNQFTGLYLPYLGWCHP